MHLTKKKKENKNCKKKKGSEAEKIFTSSEFEVEAYNKNSDVVFKKFDDDFMLRKNKRTYFHLCFQLSAVRKMNLW